MSQIVAAEKQDVVVSPSVLALREVQGLSYDEIAANLGIARGTVMSRLFHARRLLAQKLGDLPCEE